MLLLCNWQMQQLADILQSTKSTQVSPANAFASYADAAVVVATADNAAATVSGTAGAAALAQSPTVAAAEAAVAPTKAAAAPAAESKPQKRTISQCMAGLQDSREQRRTARTVHGILCRQQPLQLTLILTLMASSCCKCMSSSGGLPLAVLDEGSGACRQIETVCYTPQGQVLASEKFKGLVHQASEVMTQCSKTFWAPAQLYLRASVMMYKVVKIRLPSPQTKARAGCLLVSKKSTKINKYWVQFCRHC